MVKARADLHLHSSHSDGVYPPERLVEMAIDLGLGGIALTDHDTIVGNEELLSASAGLDIQCIPGVEISTDYEGFELHLLGYYVPENDEILEKRLVAFRGDRHSRFPKMVQKLRDMGFDIKDSDVREVLETAASPGRPHLARILIDMGVVDTIDEAFEKYLAEGKPAYVRRARPDISDGIRLLREVGAVPVLAHPLYYTGGNLRELLHILKDMGLIGVEVVYNYDRDTTLEDNIREVQRAASGLGLIETGGTDFHGDNTHNDLGSMTVPIEVIDRLREAADVVSRS
ncbi:MAG: PHP domain-containing protein [Candidatus Thorarchaeota archaeon]|nr:PHP domain-containing protein [Candidatus Thorarchaeota archaeon]